MWISILATLTLQVATIADEMTFDVVIAGGSTAAFAAALSAAEEGARTALLEPTDWVGGQLTAGGVPAVDEAWHKITNPKTGDVILDVAAIARDPRNMTPNLRDILLSIGNPGRGWVSRFCFPPARILGPFAQLEKEAAPNLQVFRETVVKSVRTDAGRITSLRAIQRRARDGRGYDHPPSEDWTDWYDPSRSKLFDKEELHFRAPVFIDATELGELMVLSGGDWLQGVEEREGLLQGNDTFGQSFTYGFVQEARRDEREEDVDADRFRDLDYGDYADKEDAWQRIWTYRRLLVKPESGAEWSLQNWGWSARTNSGGNDYPDRYLLLNKEAAQAQREDWTGGVDLVALHEAEQRAYAWHIWFRDRAPDAMKEVRLSRTALGTQHGLSKFPYVRDTRRAIGIEGFLLTFDSMAAQPDQTAGTRFPDRIALGAYPADIHPMRGKEYPAHVLRAHDTIPFHIPFRALTHQDVNNLLVAGKTMAQSFLANSATRLHPIEWSSGTAAGVAAAMMSRSGWSSAEALDHIEEIQKRVKRLTPIDWTVD